MLHNMGETDPVYYGISAALIEVAGSPQRQMNLRDGRDVIVRRYTCRSSGITSSIPSYSTADSVYSAHKLVSVEYQARGEGDLYDLTLTYETDGSFGGASVSGVSSPLPPNEIEYIAGTTERHIGAHPSYKPEWLGIPVSFVKTGSTTGITVQDPRGTPSQAITSSSGAPVAINGISTKPGLEAYLIPTGVYRKTSYSYSAPALNISNVGKRSIPTGESGTDKWLYTGYTLRVSKGVYALSEEWTFLPIGTWDTDIYPAVS